MNLIKDHIYKCEFCGSEFRVADALLNPEPPSEETFTPYCPDCDSFDVIDTGIVKITEPSLFGVMQEGVSK